MSPFQVYWKDHGLWSETSEPTGFGNYFLTMCPWPVSQLWEAQFTHLYIRDNSAMMCPVKGSSWEYKSRLRERMVYGTSHALNKSTLIFLLPFFPLFSFSYSNAHVNLSFPLMKWTWPQFTLTCSFIWTQARVNPTRSCMAWNNEFRKGPVSNVLLGVWKLRWTKGVVLKSLELSPVSI